MLYSVRLYGSSCSNSLSPNAVGMLEYSTQLLDGRSSRVFELELSPAASSSIPDAMSGVESRLAEATLSSLSFRDLPRGSKTSRRRSPFLNFCDLCNVSSSGLGVSSPESLG